MWINSKIRLAGDSKPIKTKTGTAMRTCFGFADCNDESGFPLGVVAFGKLADTLGKYHKGDTIMISGNMQVNNYTKSDGTEVTRWQVVIDGIAGVKRATQVHSEPFKKQSSDGVDYQKDEARQLYGKREFNDEIPF